MIKNIIFDLGDVIVNYNPTEYLKQFNLQDDDIDFLIKEVFNGVEWYEADKGKYTHIFDLIEPLCMRIPEYEEILKEILSEKYANIQEIRKREEEFYLSLKKQNYNMYIFSNAPKFAIDFLKQKTPIFKYSNGEMYSYEENILKPDKKIYLSLLKKYNLKPEESVFIDDNPNNIRVARELGIHGIIFKDLEQCKKELNEIINSNNQT